MQTENRGTTDCAGLYIHVPFCIRKCPYCDFYSTTDLDEMDPFLDGLLQEMTGVEKPSASFDTIHIGGGTPSLMSPGQVERLLDQALTVFPFEPDLEVSVEVNPGTMDMDFLKAFLGAGGNRLNLGVQSFSDPKLTFLGRLHNAGQARKSIAMARRSGVENLGIDLMYGLPGECREDWFEDLEAAIQYRPEHLSCYMLTYEVGTPMDQRRKAGDFQPLDARRVSTLFSDTIDYLAERGYVQYEISNFSLEGQFASRHNQKYWSHTPYMGLGPSAHSFIPFRRWWNSADLATYLTSIEAGHLPIAGREVLQKSQRMLERFFLAMRTTAGVDLDAMEEQFEERFQACFLKLCRALQDRGLEALIQVSGKRCRLTKKGLVFADTVNALFAESMDEAFVPSGFGVTNPLP